MHIKFIEDSIFKHELMEYREGDGFYRNDVPAGHAKWKEFGEGNTQLSFACPCGCGSVNQISVYMTEAGYGWKWDGDRENPTLAPSIQMLTKCKWHGHLVKGEWVTA